MRRLVVVFVLSSIVIALYFGADSDDLEYRLDDVRSSYSGSTSEASRRIETTGATNRAESVSETERRPSPRSEIAERPLFSPRIVLSGTDGEAVADARVSVFPLGALTRLTVSGKTSTWKTHEAVAELRSDAQGEVVIEGLKEGRWLVQAVRESRAGHLQLSMPAAGSRIESFVRERQAGGHRESIKLEDVRFFDVVVRDQRDRPVADALVVAIDPDSDRPEYAHAGVFPAAELDHGKTDANGRVRFVVRRGSASGLFDSARIKVLVLRYGGEPVTVTSQVSVGVPLISVTAPPMLRLTLRARTVIGDLPDVNSAPFVTWRAGPEAPFEDHGISCFEDTATVAQSIDYLVENWRLDVPREGVTAAAFAPGAVIGMTVEALGYRRNTTIIDLPNTAEHNVTVALGTAHPRVRLQVLNEFDEPFDTDKLRFDLVTAGDERRRVRMFAVEQSEERKPGDHEATLEAGMSGKIEVLDDLGRALLATIPLGRLAPGEMRELGTIRLLRFPILLAGRVLDRDRRPVMGARLRIEGASPSATVWADSVDYRLVSDARGRFEVRAAADPSRNYSVTIQGTRSSQRIEFRPGTLDLVIESEDAKTDSSRTLNAH